MRSFIHLFYKIFYRLVAYVIYFISFLIIYCFSDIIYFCLLYSICYLHACSCFLPLSSFVIFPLSNLTVLPLLYSLHHFLLSLEYTINIGYFAFGIYIYILTLKFPKLTKIKSIQIRGKTNTFQQTLYA